MTETTREFTTVERMYLDNNGKLPAFTEIGGYPIAYYDRSGDVLCAECARKILEAHRADDLIIALGSELGWDEFDELGLCKGADPVLSAMRDAIGAESTRPVPVDCDVYYEGPTMQCEECNAAIESAYGDPGEGDED